MTTVFSNVSNEIEHKVDKAKNYAVYGTGALLGGVALKPQVAKDTVEVTKNVAKKAGNWFTKTFSGSKFGDAVINGFSKVKNVASKIASPFKIYKDKGINAKIVNTFKSSMKFPKTIFGKFMDILGAGLKTRPGKIAAGSLAVLSAIKLFYNNGKIDQKYQDKKGVINALEENKVNIKNAKQK